MIKKELIRKSAVIIIARDGFYNANVKNIAEEAGIAVGTVYLYFKNKEDILDYIFCVENQKRAEFINGLYHKGETLEEVIEHFLDFHFDCFNNDLDTVKVLYMELITVNSIKEQQAKFYMNHVYEAFVNILNREKLIGGINADLDIDVLATSILYFLRIYSYNILLMDNACNYESLKSHLRSFLLHGMRG
jgi:TetR/AcrR family fatty acid metabolism transcriptional regulator